MKKFLVVKDNRIVNIFAAEYSDKITVKEGETLVEVTDDSRKYKRKERFKKLLWLFK